MTDQGADVRIGPATCAGTATGSAAEWLLTDGLGGYAMGTLPGLRTRRYHGLLVVATRPGARMVGLAALDPTLVIGERRVRLAVHEWGDGAIDPRGHLELQSFGLEDGLPVWRWS